LRCSNLRSNTLILGENDLFFRYYNSYKITCKERPGGRHTRFAALPENASWWDMIDMLPGADTQSRVRAGPRRSPNGVVTETCQGSQGVPSDSPIPPKVVPPPVDRGGPPIRMRFGIPIPTCGPGKGYSTEQQRCMPAQYIGGVIPCSQDDQTFDRGRYVPNCR